MKASLNTQNKRETKLVFALDEKDTTKVYLFLINDVSFVDFCFNFSSIK